MRNLASVRRDLVVYLRRKVHDEVLEFWRWLVPADAKPLFATALGDLFLTTPDGRVLWLDVGVGELSEVASSEKEFAERAAEPDDSSIWFGAPLVDRLRATGRKAGAGECYSYLQLPMLGGDYVPENYKVRGVVDHFRGWGPILEKLSTLPDGTRITFVVEPGDGPLK